MMNNTNKYRDLKNMIRDIFWNDWDPIGLRILDSDWDESEYDSYADRITQLLIEGKTKDQIEECLDFFTMYICEDVDNVMKRKIGIVVEKLMKLQPEIQKYYKLAVEEQKMFPCSELKRLKDLDFELRKYLSIAENKK